MRLVRVATPGGPRYGRLLDQATIELCDGPGPWALSPSGERLAAVGARLLAPCQPAKIIGIGVNYRKHAVEMGRAIPEEPVLFLKPGTALLDPGAPIQRPVGYERVDYEGELAVVIGRRCRHVSRARALEVVLGYTLVNDVTVRDLQKKDGQFTRAKGFDTFAPMGPAIVPGLDPSALQLRTRVNGELRQDSPTSDLIFDVAALIAATSRVMTLLPGDVISTGTPGGQGPLAPGDTVEIEIEGIGVLRNPVVAEPPLVEDIR